MISDTVNTKILTLWLTMTLILHGPLYSENRNVYSLLNFSIDFIHDKKKCWLPNVSLLYSIHLPYFLVYIYFITYLICVASWTMHACLSGSKWLVKQRGLLCGLTGHVCNETNDLMKTDLFYPSIHVMVTRALGHWLTMYLVSARGRYRSNPVMTT